MNLGGNMGHFFMVRHGDYTRLRGKDVLVSAETLTKLGRQQLGAVCDGIAEIIGYDQSGSEEAPVSLISSDAERALASAYFLMRRFNLPGFDVLKCFNALYYGSGDDNDQIEKCIQEIYGRQNDGVDNLVIVSHAEIIPAVPVRFAELEGIDLKGFDGCLKGQAVYFDLNRGEYQLVPEDVK